MVKVLNLPNYLPTKEMDFPGVLARFEVQTSLSSIWTQLAVFISDHEIRCTTRVCSSELDGILIQECIEKMTLCREIKQSSTTSVLIWH